MIYFWWDKERIFVSSKMFLWVYWHNYFSQLLKWSHCVSITLSFSTRLFQTVKRDRTLQLKCSLDGPTASETPCRHTFQDTGYYFCHFPCEQLRDTVNVFQERLSGSVHNYLQIEMIIASCQSGWQQAFHPTFEDRRHVQTSSFSSSPFSLQHFTSLLVNFRAVFQFPVMSWGPSCTPAGNTEALYFLKLF